MFQEQHFFLLHLSVNFPNHLFRIIAKQVQFLFGVSPIRGHFHKCFQKDALAEEPLQTLTSLCRHLLESLSSMSNDNALLTITFHEDDSVNMYMFLVFLETLHTNFH